MCLLVTLSLFYPKYMFLFQLSMAIDVAGHWIFLHTYVQWCSFHHFDFSAAVCLLFLFVSSFASFSSLSPPDSPRSSQLQGKQSHKYVDPNESPLIRMYYTKEVLFPMCVGNELFYASLYLLNFTTGPVLLGMSLFKMIAWICLPVAIGKTYMSILHMQIACQNLGIIDTNDRQKAVETAAADAAKRSE